MDVKDKAITSCKMQMIFPPRFVMVIMVHLVVVRSMQATECKIAGQFI